jgi:CheY-like chemotaxis protein
VFLPESDVPFTTAAPAQPKRPPVGGSETLLVVEDDAYLRRLVVRRLVASGYRVLEASSGNEAIESAEGTIDLLLTDVVMPGMTGVETAAALRKKWPTLRLLFMSGYSPDAAVRDGRGLDGPLLQKPFTMSDLLEHVRRALDVGQHDKSA